MESKGFSIGVLVKKGWALMKEHIGTYIGFLIVYLVFMCIPGFVSGVFPDLHVGLQVLIQVVSAILAIVVFIGVYKISLKAVDGVSPSFTDLFSGFKIIIQWIIATIFYAIIVMVGTILLVFPGVIWGAKYFVWPFVMIDKGVGPIKALEMSSDLTMGTKWDVFMMMFVSTVIVFLGLMIVFVGWFAALPVTLLAQAAMYRLLESQKETM
ncbi:MAG: hypothetical protein K940chlam3_00830 [Chlamydiae bacterium]|nr:hypothetical protein [Chlamydiota bacterium]